jgi:RNA polymerase sigma-70 factor (ECF subfamily)
MTIAPAAPAPHTSRATDGPDADLVRDVAAGSEAALATLYDRHSPLVYGAALRLTTDRTRAEEVVMETFLALWNHADRFDPGRGSLGAWLTVIARNTAVDLHRRRAHHDATLPLAALSADREQPEAALDWVLGSGRLIAFSKEEASPSETLQAAETRQELAAALVQLPADERAAVLLAYRDGLSQTEIADRLGWPLGTVKTRSRRALRRLRGLLGDAHMGDSHLGGGDPMASVARRG